MAWLLPGWRGPLKGLGSLEPGLLAEASSLAEELVADAFSLTSRDLRFLQYEVFTERDLLFFPLPESALAGLVRGETQALLPRKRRPFYWLLLSERKILSLAEGRDFLYALLLYIFTHEFVHMVRFLRFAACFWMSPEFRFQEEKVVHNVARKILTRVPVKELRAVLSRFDQIYARG